MHWRNPGHWSRDLDGGACGWVYIYARRDLQNIFMVAAGKTPLACQYRETFWKNFIRCLELRVGDQHKTNDDDTHGVNNQCNITFHSEPPHLLVKYKNLIMWFTAGPAQYLQQIAWISPGNRCNYQPGPKYRATLSKNKILFHTIVPVSPGPALHYARHLDNYLGNPQSQPLRDKYNPAGDIGFPARKYAIVALHPLG